MRYDNQVLYDRGFRTLAYQLEALADKAPEAEDDILNLTAIITATVVDLENDVEGSYDEGYEDGKDEGYEDGKEEGLSDGYEEGYSDGHADGLTEGYEDGYQEGLEEGQSAII